MTVLLEVDVDSGVPVYEQIRGQVVAHVAAGRLVAGDHLPTVRALAGDLGIAPGTVARAYRELEAAGAVTSRRRAGTVVTGSGAVEAGPRAAARTYVRTARDAGLTDEQVLDLVRGALLDGGAAPTVAHEH
ncbi:MAG TPA: GntR family transcriptional regulator [Cellulomonas sp.]